MTDEFDDDALRDAIGSRSGGPVDTGPARQAVIARARRTRALRTAAIGGTAALVITGLLLLPNADDTPTAPAGQPAAPTTGAITVPGATTIAGPDTTDRTPDTTAATDRATVAPAEPTTTTPAAAATTGSTTSLATQPTPAAADPPATTTTSAPAAPPTTTTTTTATTTTALDPPDPPFTQRYDSAGGSITVEWDGASLVLVSVAANDGYETEIEDQTASRVRVRFRGSDDDSRIEVRVRDGHVDHTIS